MASAVSFGARGGRGSGRPRRLPGGQVWMENPQPAGKEDSAEPLSRGGDHRPESLTRPG